MSSLVLHVGYPKTATTTFQQHVFPRHPDIDYLGKFIPSYGYVDDILGRGFDDLMHRSSLRYDGGQALASFLDKRLIESSGKCVLVSSESFVHPSAVDLQLVAERIFKICRSCKIVITIREQASAIKSFYGMHGRYGQYLTIGPKEERDVIRYPIPFTQWLQFQRSAEDQNYLGTLNYDAVIGCYMNIFGVDNVGVFLYEQFAQNPDDYAEALGGFLGVDRGVLKTLMHGKREWQSPSTALQTEGKSVVYKLRAKWRGAKANNESLSQMEQQMGLLRERYREGNARLQRDHLLPLSQYGYCV